MNLMPLNEFEARSGRESGVVNTPSPEEQPARSGWSVDFGNVGRGLSEYATTVHDAFVAGNVSERNSNYANRRLQKQVERLKKVESEQTTAEGVVGGLAKYGTAAALGAVNPALGAGVMGSLGFADSLVEQSREGLTPSMGRASSVGVVSGGIDALTGGLGSMIAKPGSALVKRGLTAMGEDAISAGAEQAAVNLSADRDATDNLASTMAMGAAGGAVLRPLMKGAQAMGGSKQAAEDVAGTFTGSVKPNDSFVQRAADQRTRANEGFDNLDQAVDAADIKRSVNDIVEGSVDGGTDASVRALKIFSDSGMPITDAALSARIPNSLRSDAKSTMLGEDIAGMDLASIRGVGDISKSAERTGWFTKDDINKGFTKEEHEIRTQDGFNAANRQVLGTFTTNKVKAQEILDSGSFAKGSPAEKDLSSMIKSLNAIEEASKGISKKNKSDISSIIEHHSKNFLEKSSNLGLNKEFVDEMGQAGRWNPISTMQTANAMEIIGRNQMHNIHQATPDPAKAARSAVGDIGNIAGSVLTGGLLPLGRKLAKEGVGKYRRSQLKGAVKKGSKRAQDLDKAVMDKLKSGDLAGAANAAGRSLSASGLASKPTSARASTKPLEEPIVNPDSIQPTRMDEPVQAPVEAPVAAPVDVPKAEAPSLKTSAKITVDRPKVPEAKPVGKRDRVGEAKILEARSENALIDKLISNKDADGSREAFLAEMGSLKGLRKKLSESTNPKESPEKFFNDEFKKAKDAKAKEATETRDKTRKAEAETKAKEKAARDQATYEDDLKTILKRNGISDEDGAVARKEFVGEGEVLTREKMRSIVAAGKELKAGREAEAVKTEAKAKEEATAKTDKVSLASQRGKVTKAVNGITGAGPEFNAVRDSIQAQMKRASKPLTDAQLESISQRIEKAVNAELKRLKTAFTRSGDDSAQKLSEKLRKAIGQSDETIAGMRKDLEEAREVAVAAEKARVAKKPTAEKQKFDEESFEKSTDYGVDAGLTSRDIKRLRKDATVGDKFDMNRFKKLVDSEVSVKAAKQQKAFEEKYRGASEEDLKVYAKDLIDEDMASKVTTPELKAQMDAMDAVNKEGVGGEVTKLVRTYGNAMDIAKSRKERFPKNPELWLSRDSIDDIQKSMGKTEGSSHSGSVAVRLRTKIYGSSKARDLMSEEAIQEVIARKTKAGGKLGGEGIKAVMAGRTKARMRKLK